MSQWIRERQLEREKLIKLVPSDRLAYVDACIKCLRAIGNSNLGWIQWLSNPSLMSEFDEETLKEFFERLKDFAAAYLEFDMEATKKGMKPDMQKHRPYL